MCIYIPSTTNVRIITDNVIELRAMENSPIICAKDAPIGREHDGLYTSKSPG